MFCLIQFTIQQVHRFLNLAYFLHNTMVRWIGTTPYRDGGFEPPNEIGPPSMDSPCLGYPSSIVEYASPDHRFLALSLIGETATCYEPQSIQSPSVVAMYWCYSKSSTYHWRIEFANCQHQLEVLLS